jgi:hypothetical protein
MRNEGGVAPERSIGLDIQIPVHYTVYINWYNAQEARYMRASEKKKLTVYLRPEEYKNLMYHCIDTDQSASGILERLVRKYLAKLPKAKRS